MITGVGFWVTAATLGPKSVLVWELRRLGAGWGCSVLLAFVPFVVTNGGVSFLGV